MRKLAGIPGFVFTVVVVWKLALFAFTAQPIPLCDSFFHDGPVVNFLNGGSYCNPSLELVLPIAGRDVFAAYPPLYHTVLFGWMSVFGTSALSAMALHQVLFALYALVLLGIFRQLKTPAVWVNLAGLFLFVNTFHDRPDSLAILFGVSSIYAWLRARNTGFQSRVTTGTGKNAAGRTSARQGTCWDWLAAGLIILTLCSSLQFGSIYLGCLWVMAFANAMLRRERMPWLPLASTVLIPVLLVMFVKLGYPRLWEGFQEHAARTPGVTGLRAPTVAEMLKALRTLPGFGLSLFLLAGLWWKRQGRVIAWFNSLASVVWLGGVAAVIVFMTAALTFLSGNSVLAAGYLQPLVVGIFLAAFAGDLIEHGRKWFWPSVFIVLAAVCATRAVGMTTWGIACAVDVSYNRAMKMVRAALDATPPGSTVALSAAYLYQGVQNKQVRVLHSDWLTPPDGGGVPRADAIVALRPSSLVLTQFDRYRLYDDAISDLQRRTNVVRVNIVNMATTPVPDASRKFQRFVQHISWAPVIVELTWK